MNEKELEELDCLEFENVYCNLSSKSQERLIELRKKYEQYIEDWIKQNKQKKYNNL